MALTDLNYRPDIDGLRAVAIIAVVGYHAFPGLIPNGFLGVDVFFVISGFVITHSLLRDFENNSFSYRQFIERRIIRLFPALLVVFASCLAFGWFTLFADEYMQLAKHILAGTTFSANYVLWSEAGYFDVSASAKPMLHLWSLAIEEQFYLVWPFLVLLAWRKKMRLLVLIAMLAFGSFAYALSYGTGQSAGFFLPLPRIWELACGCGLAIADGSGRLAQIGQRLRLTMCPLGIAMIVFAFAASSRLGQHPGMGTLLPVAGTMLAIAGGPQTVFSRFFLGSWPMVQMGLVSYPFYLWHWPLLSLMYIILGETPPRYDRIAAVLLAFVLACLTYKFVELPLKMSVRKSTAVALLCGMVFMGMLSGAFYVLEGLDQRTAIKGLPNNRNELLRTVSRDMDCLAKINIVDPLFNYCRFADRGSTKTVAIIGDSHAHVAFPGIAEYLTKNATNTLMLANSSCPPLLGAPAGIAEVDKALCERRMRQMIDTVSSLKDIDKVIIFTRGPYYFENSKNEQTEAIRNNNVRITPEEFAFGLAKTADELTRNGKRVYYVIENPELVQTAASCIVRPLNFRKKDCRPLKSSVLARQASYRKALQGIHSVTIIDSLDVFCPKEMCIAFDNNALLYADKDHLSVVGSRYQAMTLLSKYLRETNP